MMMKDVKVSTTFFVIVPTFFVIATLNVFARAWSSVKNNIGNFGWKMLCLMYGGLVVGF